MNHWLAFIAICVSGSLLSARIFMRALTFHFDPMSELLAGVEGKLQRQMLSPRCQDDGMSADA
jgi:hypothetical protein